MSTVTFGEVMLRLSPAGHLRLSQVLPGSLDATFGGAEVNVAVAIALQGGAAAFATVLPDNAITEAFEAELRRLRVETRLIRRSTHGRFGIYFVENGANQRASTVTYDRDASSLALQPAGSYRWDEVLESAHWFHVTGITPALGAEPAAAALTAVKTARLNGLVVSCDLNFRKKLWRWRPGVAPQDLAKKVMSGIVAEVDLLIANEEDASTTLGITAGASHVHAGQLDLDGYMASAREIVARFPNIKHVAISLRESISASHNNWGGMLYSAATDTAVFAPVDSAGKYRPYEIRNIVDRVGAGDAFGAGLIFALQTPALSDPATAIRYAVAASCLKHSIVGDFCHATRGEIEALMHGDVAGRVQR